MISIDLRLRQPMISLDAQIYRITNKQRVNRDSMSPAIVPARLERRPTGRLRGVPPGSGLRVWPIHGPAHRQDPIDARSTPDALIQQHGLIHDHNHGLRSRLPLSDPLKALILPIRGLPPGSGLRVRLIRRIHPEVEISIAPGSIGVLTQPHIR